MFKVGDMVKVLEGGSYGHVIDIGSIAEVVGIEHINSTLQPYVLVYGFRSRQDYYLCQSIHPNELELLQ